MSSSTNLNVVGSSELDPILSGDLYAVLGKVMVPSKISQDGLLPLPKELDLGERVDFSKYAKSDVKESGSDLEEAGEKSSPHRSRTGGRKSWDDWNPKVTITFVPRMPEKRSKLESLMSKGNIGPPPSEEYRKHREDKIRDFFVNAKKVFEETNISEIFKNLNTEDGEIAGLEGKRYSKETELYTSRIMDELVNLAKKQSRTRTKDLIFEKDMTKENVLEYIDVFNGDDIADVFGVNQFYGFMFLNCIGVKFNNRGEADSYKIVLALHDNEDGIDNALLDSEYIWNNLSFYFGARDKDELIGSAYEIKERVEQFGRRIEPSANYETFTLDGMKYLRAGPREWIDNRNYKVPSDLAISLENGYRKLQGIGDSTKIEIPGFDSNEFRRLA